jgi:hypothetical protein
MENVGNQTAEENHLILTFNHSIILHIFSLAELCGFVKNVTEISWLDE